LAVFFFEKNLNARARSNHQNHQSIKL